jgi:hypothetical protein
MILAVSPSFSINRPSSLRYADALKWRATRNYTSEEPAVGQEFARLGEGAVYGFNSSFVNIDACDMLRQDLLVRGVLDLRLARDSGFQLNESTLRNVDLSVYSRNYLPRNDEPFARAVGCHTPKLQLVPNPVYVASQQKAAALIRTFAQGTQSGLLKHATPVERGPIDRYPLIEAPAQPPAASTDTQGMVIAVAQFSPNRLELNVVNPYKPNAWLIYLDAFTPRWRATIDGSQAPIRRVNLAFKGILLPSGDHHVIFFLDDPIDTVLYMLLAFILCLAGVWFLAISIQESLSAHIDNRRDQ